MNQWHLSTVGQCSLAQVLALVSDDTLQVRHKTRHKSLMYDLVDSTTVSSLQAQYFYDFYFNIQCLTLVDFSARYFP